MSKPWVKWTILAIALAIIGWDVWLWLDGEQGNTISYVGSEAADGVGMILNFVIGFLCGHIFWGQPKR